MTDAEIKNAIAYGCTDKLAVDNAKKHAQAVGPAECWHPENWDYVTLQWLKRPEGKALLRALQAMPTTMQALVDASATIENLRGLIREGVYALSLSETCQDEISEIQNRMREAVAEQEPT